VCRLADAGAQGHAAAEQAGHQADGGRPPRQRRTVADQPNPGRSQTPPRQDNVEIKPSASAKGGSTGTKYTGRLLPASEKKQ